ncbi:ASKHA domain-containing protein [Amorphus coralli]|uniref:ASKHA domain-containing protein n=1 Tax=Amorphus coralli TaxID=340680 RepID=UPI000373E077|nr:ASKHA domain-containing protein [Amorphus coralli]
MDERSDALVVFQPSGRRGRFPLGTPLLDAARSLGVYVESVCGGRGLCGRCQVSVEEGAFSKHQIVSSVDNLTPFSETEARYRRLRSLPADRRLSCSAKVMGDLVVDVPQDVASHRALVRKRAEGRPIAVDPSTHLVTVTVEEPSMETPRGDADRLIDALVGAEQMVGLSIDMPLLAQVQKTLRAGHWRVTAAIHSAGDSHTVIGLWPGEKARLFGLAVDIGSTTIAAHLCDLGSGRTVASAGTSNPQVRFGEDLMSRVSYILMNPDAVEKLTEAVRGAVGVLIEKVAAEAGIAADEIVEAVFVGNPIMHHLFLGIDPTELGGAPFAMAVSGSVSASARDLGLAINPCARVYVPPLVAGHVGADAAAATLAEGPGRVPPGDGAAAEAVTLLVDIGTNAEIVLGRGERVIACSSPTGPAFEGAEISSGQRAAPGAIERVRIDPATLEPKFKVIGCDLWSDEEGFEEAVAGVGITGVCGSGIVEAIGEMFLAGILTEDGVIDGRLVAQSDRIVPSERTFAYVLHAGLVDLRVTQGDVRAIQLAKAALYAGIKLLMTRLEVEAVDRIRLAGAFGSYIDPKYAMVIGLIPDCPLEQVSAVGNAAGTGARMVLLNKTHRAEIEDLVGRIEKVETALEPAFQGHFVSAMALPNKVDRFPNLSASVPLPLPRTTARGETTGDEGADARASGRPRSRRGARKAAPSDEAAE